MTVRRNVSIAKLVLVAPFVLLLSVGCLAQIKSSQGLFAAYTAERCGYIDPEGKMVIRQQFDSCWPFSEGLAAVVQNRKLGFIDETGNVVIKPQFDWHLTYFSEGFAPVSISDNAGRAKYGYVDKKGKVIWLPSITYASNFVNGLAVVERRALNGYINKDMQFVIEPTFNFADSFADGLARVCRDDFKSCFYINNSGQKVIDRRGGPFSEGVAFFETDHKYGLMDTSGRILIVPQFDDAEMFCEGLAAIRIQDKWGYVDKSGRVVIAPQFDKAGCFARDGIAPVMKNGKYGFIDKTGGVVIAFEFDSAEWLSSGLGIVEKDKKQGYINRDGLFVWWSQSD